MRINLWVVTILLWSCIVGVQAQTYTAASPDSRLSITVKKAEMLSYSVTFADRTIIEPSVLGFEFEGEPAMAGGFQVIGERSGEVRETWTRWSSQSVCWSRMNITS